jgi:hypothetical protein
LLTKSFGNPFLWYETKFPKELEVAGMKKEMESMVNFEVSSEVPVETLSEHELPHAISSCWVKTREPDGTVRCRLVFRGFHPVVDDPGYICEHSKPHDFEAVFGTFGCVRVGCFNRRHFHSCSARLNHR